MGYSRLFLKLVVWPHKKFRLADRQSWRNYKTSMIATLSTDLSKCLYLQINNRIESGRIEKPTPSKSVKKNYLATSCCPKNFRFSMKIAVTEYLIMRSNKYLFFASV